MSERMRWCVVVAFAAAMAWVESAVVVYLRTMIGRIIPYQPNPLPSFAGLGGIEVVRELATMVMIGTVGWLAGRTWRGRVGYAMLIFGVWDILYYVFLRPMTGWPSSLLDWDILFLLPLPWWGPVVAPASIAAIMIATGTLLGQWNQPGQLLWPRWSAWAVSLVGVLLAMYTFMADAIASVGGGVETIPEVLPHAFNWPLYLVALVLLAAPMLDLGYQLAARRTVQRPLGMPERYP